MSLAVGTARAKTSWRRVSELKTFWEVHSGRGQSPQQKNLVGGAFEVHPLIGRQLFYEGLAVTPALVQSAAATGAWSEAELHPFLGVQVRS